MWERSGGQTASCYIFRRYNSLRSDPVLLLVLAACGGEPELADDVAGFPDAVPSPSDAVAVYAPDAGFWSAPVPSDARSWADYDVDAPTGLWERYKPWLPAEQAPLGPVWFPVALGDDPQPPEGAVHAAVWHDDGGMTPVEVQVSPFTTPDAYVTRTGLQVRPAHGAIWPEGSRVLVWLTTDAAARPDAFQAALDADPTWRALEEDLTAAGHDPARLAMATTFTVGLDGDELMDWGEAALAHDPIDDVSGWGLELLQTQNAWTLYEGSVDMPFYPEGTPPFLSEGGAVQWSGDGPVVAATQSVPVWLSIPDGEAPAEGWPVMIYVHGTGGNHESPFAYTGLPSTATFLAGLDVALLGVSLPLHGGRPGTDDNLVELTNFNMLNPDSALHLHRQGAVELSLWVDALARSGGDTLLPVDPDRIGVIGHSQGGITASIALPLLQGRIAGAVLSGAGGLVVDNGLLRAEAEVIKSSIGAALGIPADELTEPLHPLLGLAQGISSRTDPVLYATRWPELPLLQVGGADDVFVTATSQKALAVAGGLGRHVDCPHDGLADLPVEQGAGGVCWIAGDHFVYFTDDGIRERVVAFVQEIMD